MSSEDLIKNLKDGEIIPFTQAQSASNIAVIICSLLSLSAVTVAISALVKQRSIPLDTRFIVSMLVADFLLALMCAIACTINGKMRE